MSSQEVPDLETILATVLASATKQSASNPRPKKITDEEKLLEIIKSKQLIFDEENTYVIDNDYRKQRVLPAPTSEFKEWLCTAFHDKYQSFPGYNAIKNVCMIVSNEILKHGTKSKVHNKSAFDGKYYYIDLLSEDYSCFKIGKDYFEVVCPSPILFERHRGMQEFSIDKTEIDIFKIFDFIPVYDRNDQVLIISWLVSCLIGKMDKQILLLNGPPQSGKSLAASMIRSIVDPVADIKLNLPLKKDDFMLSLYSNSVPLYDNVSKIGKDIADEFCKAVTGATYSKKALYADTAEIKLQINRPVILTSTTIPSNREDFLDRIITIAMNKITETQMKCESDILNNFIALLPRFRYALLKLLHDACSEMENFNIVKSTRFKDFNILGAAISRVLGISANEFMLWKFENVMVAELKIKMFHGIFKLIRNFAYNNKKWSGTTAELYKALLNANQHVSQFIKSEDSLGSNIKLISSYLSRIGIEISVHHSVGKSIKSFKVNKLHFAEEQVLCTGCQHYKFIDLELTTFCAAKKTLLKDFDLNTKILCPYFQKYDGHSNVFISDDNFIEIMMDIDITKYTIKNL